MYIRKSLLAIFSILTMLACRPQKEHFESMPEVLPGFTAIAAPNEFEIPGTIFSVDKQKVRQPITTLKVSIQRSEVAVSEARGYKKSNVGSLLGFLGSISTMTFSQNKQISYELQLKDNLQERLQLMDIETQLQEVKLDIKKFAKENATGKLEFYIVTESVKAKRLTYAFSTNRSGEFEYKTDIDQIVKMNPKIKWENEKHSLLAYDLDKPLYVYAKYFKLKVDLKGNLRLGQEVKAGEPIYINNKNLLGIAYRQTAAEFKALCFQAYNIAKYKVNDEIAKNRGDTLLAVITDIDDTIFDSSPYSVQTLESIKTFEPEVYHRWLLSASADTIAGSASFFNYAKSNHVEVFYVTNRQPDEIEATIKNLKKFGFPNADDAHIFPKTSTSSKSQRYYEIGKKFKIILYIGDSLSDFVGDLYYSKSTVEKRNELVRSISGKFGNTFIILPNSEYGDWQGAIYNYDYKLSPKQQDSILRIKINGN